MSFSGESPKFFEEADLSRQRFMDLDKASDPQTDVQPESPTNENAEVGEDQQQHGA